jgi:outer membrane receptor protein involved in Fe transport
MGDNGYPRVSAIAAAVSAALAGAHSANAQEQGVMLEEVIVTATKREVSLRDIPASITAFTSDDISRRGFKGFDDYSRQIPSLAVASREPLGNTVVFRGVTASGIQFESTNPSAGLYLDEQPITSSGNNANPRLIDIERVEALSGPQGTLFGDASQSGTLRIITNKPDVDAFEAWVEADVSSVSDGDTGWDLSGMVNVPLSETAALRLVGFTSEEAGYIDNVLGTSSGGTFDNASLLNSDIGGEEFSGGRAALRFEPNDRWTVDVSAIFQTMEADGFGDADFDRGGAPEQVRFQQESYEDEWYQLALTLEGRTDIGDFVFSASYFNRDVRYDGDATSYQFAFQELSDYYQLNYNQANGQNPGDPDYVDFYFYDFGGDPRGSANDTAESERFSMEVRWSTPADSDSRWQGLVGAFYSKSEIHDVFTSEVEDFGGTKAFYYLAYNGFAFDNGLSSINGLPPGSWYFSDNWFFGVYDQTIEQVALFGEATVDLTDNFSITLGGRWYDVEREVGQLLGGLRQGSVPNAATDYIFTDATGKESESGFVPKVNLTYRLNDDNLIYATYSEGFRSGGANALRPNSVLPRSFESDELTNFEVGYKGTLAGGSLFVELVAFTMVWEDFQIQVNDPQPAVFQLGIVNFPEATITGAELAFDWLPAADWRISASLANTNAEISETQVLFPDTGAELTAIDGTQLPITPEWKANLSIEYTLPTEWLGGEPFVRFDYTHVDESINALAGLEATVVSPPPTIQEAYDIANLRVGVDGDDWSASVYINNLFDDDGQQFINNRWAAPRRVSLTRPMTIGFNVRRKFQ